MYFKLTNGTSVNFRSNEEAAKFVYLVMPFKGLKFEGSDKPHITMNSSISHILRLHNKLMERKNNKDEIQRRIDSLLLPFDDDVPF